jgi:hypothetical protein
MELKNGYKVVYDKAANNEHTFFAAKANTFTGAEEIVSVVAGEYKLVYEKAGKFYGSKTGIPADGDYCFAEFDKVFTEAASEPVVVNETQPEPEAINETPANVEDPVADETAE